ANVQWLTSNRDIKSYIGEHFVSFSNTGGWTFYGNKQNEPLKAGETYVATAMIRTKDVTSGGGIIKFDLYDGIGNYLGEKVSKTITQSNDDWTRVLVVLTYDEAKRINNAAISIKLSIGTLAPTAGTLYFDAVNWLSKPVLTQLEYDSNKNYVTLITNPLGYSVSLVRTDRGNLANMTLPRKGMIIYGYDPLDRLTYIQNQATNAIYEIIYDKNGNILNLGFYELVNGNKVWKSQIKQTFNERNQIRTHEDQRGNQTVYNYDANGNLELVSFPNNTKLKLAYDSLDRLKTKQDLTFNNSWAFSYDKNNNLTQVIQTSTSGQEVTDYILDNLIDEVKSITYPMVNGIRRSVNYTYNANGQITTISHSPITQKLGVDAIYRYDYDQAGMMASLNGPNKEQVGQFYDEAGRLKKSFISDGTKAYNTYYEYNELGDLKEYRLETADGVILSREKHAYDGDGNTTVITYDDGSKHSFQYDLASRLTNEQKIASNGAVLTTISYQYDPYGNRLTITKNGTTTTYKYDTANQISSVNGSAGIYQYDQNGNQIRDDRHKYYYDSSNRLSYVEQANAVVAIASYSYDYEGKRTKKMVYGKKTEQYYYDAGHLTYIADENNQILYSFTRTYPGDLVTMTDYTSGTAVNYYYVHNGHGDIIGLKDKTGTTVVTYEYDAFGNIIKATGTAKTGNGRLLREENPFRYASYFYDEETKLYYLRMRFYDPLIGRYLTRDIVPSANLYVYTENNPVRYVDPFGLSFFSKIKSLYQKAKAKVTSFFKSVYNSVSTTIKSIKTKKVEFSPGQQAAITIGAAGVGSSVDYKVSKTNTRISSQQSTISNKVDPFV
ncbi:RHS repeat-associated core domain-containing protein, partial [Schinkia azotoformans]